MLRSIFVFGILTVGIPLAVYSPFYALLLYLWYAMFRPEFFVWFDLTPYRLSLALGILLLLRASLSGKFPNLSHPLSIGAVAFLATAVVSQVTAVDVQLGWFWIDYFARLVCVSLLLVTLVDTRQKFYLTIAVIATSFGFYSTKAGIGSMLGGGLRFAEGLTGSFGDNNGYALGIAMILPFLIAAAQNAPVAWMRWGFFATVPLSAFTVVSLFSRGGLLALGASASVAACFQKHRVRSLLLLATVAAGGYLFAPIPAGWFERVETIQTYEEVQDRSALGRLHFWRVAVDMASDRPLGVGLRNYEAAYDRYDSSGGRFGVDRAVHSSHFQVLAETGFPGAAIWVTLFLIAFMLVFRIRRRSRDPRLSKEDAAFLLTMGNAMMASIVGFLIGGAFASAALNDLTWLTFGLVAALDRISFAMCTAPATAPAGESRTAPSRVLQPATLAGAHRRDVRT